MPFHGIFAALVLLLVAAAVVALVRFLIGGGHDGRGGGRLTGLDILEESYAKGEIQRDEYLQKKRDLDLGA